MATAPHLVQVHEQHHDAGLLVIGVTEETVPTAMQFASQQGWDGKIPVAVDENARLRHAFGVRVYPTTVLIDRRGIVRWRGEGAPPAEIDAQVAKLLAEPGGG